MQLIYKGKNSQSFLKITFPDGFSLSANEKHFSSSTNESKKYLKKIIIPHVGMRKEKRKESDQTDQAVLLSWDVFRG